ncbi:glycosyltransferase [Streptomyces sp. A1547]|uniref:glycosyltransferase family 2 protein n=1 Tax=Streptomyces sp. A1547 TaxID=2563105 RepID=UPI00109E916A|nr:glycosyltransferase [Streptomyces sp. A1547]THA33708.1 glycosyltransferase [Streptomyces sp. A1547]
MSRTPPLAGPVRRGTQASTVSLVISTLDEGTELHATLESVFAGSVVADETIVVDDGGTDGSCTVLEQAEWRARGVVVRRIRRSGVAAARNAGARLARGTHLVFLDAHCRLERSCLARLREALDTGLDAVFAPAVRDVGSTAAGCGARLIDAHLRVRWLPPEPDGAAPYPVPLAPGGCLAVRRATFDRLGGFGAFRELGLEDVDFSLRAWRAGVDVLAVPGARLAHRFRSYPPYRLSSTSRAYNLVRVALVHFDGSRREECLRKVIGTPRAAEVLVEAFAGNWEEQRAAVETRGVRSVEAYFERFGDWR